LWSHLHSYSVGDLVQRDTTHHYYEAVATGIDATPPENAVAGNSARWIDRGVINEWAMFDDESSSQTVATDTLTVVMQFSGFVNHLSLIRLVGRSARITVESRGIVVFDNTYSLDGTIITGWWSWLFEESVQKETLAVNLPPYVDPIITVSISGMTTVKCGVCQAGATKYIGRAQKRSGWGYRDFSTVVENPTYGTITSYVKRGNKDVLNVVLLIEAPYVAAFRQVMRSLINSFCVWIPSDDDKLQFLTTYGYVSQLDVVMETAQYSTYTLTIRGL
jgi:hypothetical protein